MALSELALKISKWNINIGHGIYAVPMEVSEDGRYNYKLSRGYKLSLVLRITWLIFLFTYSILLQLTTTDSQRGIFALAYAQYCFFIGSIFIYMQYLYEELSNDYNKLLNFHAHLSTFLFSITTMFSLTKYKEFN